MATVGAMETQIDINKESNAAESEKENDNNSTPEIEDVFSNSTHSYLIYFGRDKNCNGFILGVVTMVIQFILYGVMINEGVSQIEADKVTVITDWSNCQSGGWGWGGGELYEVTSLECQVDESTTATILGGFSLACIVLVYFIERDLLSCMKIWFKVPGCWAKLMGCVIFFEALYAFYTGVVFALFSVNNGSSYDAIVNCIGVLFVHDLDEKLYEAAEVIKKDEMTKKFLCCACNCCKNYCQCCCIICVLLLAVIAGYICVFIILGSQA